MSDDPFDLKAVQTESEFMRRLAKLIREYRDHMDTSTMAGDLERSLAALDEKMLTEWGPPPTPRGGLELDTSGPAERPSRPSYEDRPVTAALDDRDHRIAQLEATVKELYAKLK